jgi:hypothetical protein
LRTLLCSNIFFSCLPKANFTVRSEHVVESASLLPLKELAQDFAFSFSQRNFNHFIKVKLQNRIACLLHPLDFNALIIGLFDEGYIS